MRQLFTLLCLAGLILWIIREPGKHDQTTTPYTPPNLEQDLRESVQQAIDWMEANEEIAPRSVKLKSVKFKPTGQGIGEYTAVIAYDLIRPLSVETGWLLLKASCATGLAKVQLTDQHGTTKTFSCQTLEN